VASAVTFMETEHTECLKAVTMRTNQTKDHGSERWGGLITETSAVTGILFGKVGFILKDNVQSHPVFANRFLCLSHPTVSVVMQT